MKKQLQKLLNRANRTTTNWAIKAHCLRSDVCSKLQDKSGSLTVEQIIMIIVVIVLITGLAMPKIWKTLSGSLDGADSKIDDIWNYKG